MARGLVPARPNHQSANQRSVCALERRKRAQRIRGFALSGDSFRRGRFRRISGGPFFSVLPEKNGEKRGAWLRFGAYYGYNSGKPQCLSLYEHT